MRRKKQKRQVHIYLAILNTGWVRRELSQALVAMVLTRDRRIAVRLDYPEERPIPSCRNLARKRALEAEADFLLMFDSDNWPRGEIAVGCNPLDLALLDLDVVGLPYPIWRPGVPEPAVVLSVTPLDGATVDLAGGGVREVRRVGAGGLLVARRVLEALPPFGYDFDEWGLRLGDEDVRYCDQARAAGFKVWAACDWLLGHSKEIDLVTVHEEIVGQHRVLTQQTSA